MGKKFRSCDLNQAYLLTSSLAAGVAAGGSPGAVCGGGGGGLRPGGDLCEVRSGGWAGAGGVRSADDGAGADLWLLPWGGEFAADRAGDPRGRGIPLLGGRPASGSRHDRGVPAGALGKSGAVVRAGVAVVP